MTPTGPGAAASEGAPVKETETAAAASADGPAIRLHLLGSVRLSGTASADAILAQPRRTAVLAYLALAQRAGFVRRDTLAAAFWPENDSARARTALRKVVHGLREALGEASIQSRGDEELRLAPSVVWCDVTHFRLAMSAEDHEAALVLYEGPLLEGFFADAPEFERLVETERRAFAEAAAAAAWQLADTHEKHSQPTLATRWARQAVRIGGADERLLRKSLQLLKRQGDVAGALALYEEFAARIRRDLEAEPSQETRAVVSALRSG